MNIFNFSCFSDDGTCNSNDNHNINENNKVNDNQKCPSDDTISHQVAMSHYNVGCSLQEEGKLEEAINNYRKAISEDPEFCDAHYNLANGEHLIL